MGILNIDENLNDTPKIDAADMIKIYLEDHGLLNNNEPFEFYKRELYHGEQHDEYFILDDDVIVKSNIFTTMTKHRFATYKVWSPNSKLDAIYVVISPGIIRRLTWKMVKDYFHV